MYRGPSSARGPSGPQRTESGPVGPLPRLFPLTDELREALSLVQESTEERREALTGSLLTGQGVVHSSLYGDVSR